MSQRLALILAAVMGLSAGLVGCDSKWPTLNPNYVWRPNRETTGYVKRAQAFSRTDDGIVTVVILWEGVQMDDTEEVGVLEVDSTTNQVRRGIFFQTVALEYGLPHLKIGFYACLPAAEVQVRGDGPRRLSFSGLVEGTPFADYPKRSNYMAFNVTTQSNRRRVNEVLAALESALAEQGKSIWSLCSER